MHKPSLDQIDFGEPNVQEVPVQWGYGLAEPLLVEYNFRDVERTIFLQQVGVPADALEPSPTPQTDQERTLLGMALEQAEDAVERFEETYPEFLKMRDRLKARFFAELYGGHNVPTAVVTGRT